MGANDSVIIIFDNVSRKLMEFDFEGTLIQETKLQEDLWANDIFFFNDNLYFYADWHKSTWAIVVYLRLITLLTRHLKIICHLKKSLLLLEIWGLLILYAIKCLFNLFRM